MWLTLLPTLIVNSKQTDTELCTRDYIGWGVWMAGMVIECIADYQKYSFRSNAANKYVCNDCSYYRSTVLQCFLACARLIPVVRFPIQGQVDKPWPLGYRSTS